MKPHLPYPDSSTLGLHPVIVKKPVFFGLCVQKRGGVVHYDAGKFVVWNRDPFDSIYVDEFLKQMKDQNAVYEGNGVFRL